MSCDHVQELISPLLDRQVRTGEREKVLAHLESCKECSIYLESMDSLRRTIRSMGPAPVPSQLAARLRVLASHERQRQLSRATFHSRLEFWSVRVRLWFDNLMRPVALPFAGGLVSALVLFSLLVPSLSFRHDLTDDTLIVDPDGQVVFLGSSGPYTPPSTLVDTPRIEPVYADSPDDANVVWLAVDGDGKVAGYSLTRGQLTPDLQNIIMISKFNPATFLGMPTPGLVKVVQRTPRRRSLRS